MSDSAPPKPRKRPQQSRSLLLVNAIREACLRILEDEGPDKLTTQRIADVAGINIASLYQYFPNKEAVLAEIYEQEMEKYGREAARKFDEIATLAEQSLEATLEAIIEMEASQLLQLYAINPDFYQQYQKNYDIHRKVNELTQSFHNPAWEEWFPRFLGKHRARLRPGDLDTMSIVARNSLQGNLQAALSEQPELLSDANFKTELLTLLLNYLLAT